MTRPATSVPDVKRRLLELLHARPALSTVAVGYDPPKSGAQLEGPTGEPASIHFGTSTTASSEILVFGDGVIRYDETVTLPVVIQTWRALDTWGQYEADVRAAELLAELLAIPATDPTLGLGLDDGFDYVTVEPAGWTHIGGYLPNEGHGARFEVNLEITARVTPGVDS